MRRHTRIASPLGPLLAEADADGAITRVSFGGEPTPGSVETPLTGGGGPFDALAAQLAEYFARTRTTFDLPLAPEGTEFQRRVWAALREIPFGRTLSYGALAARLGGATLTRAVGRANGANPIGIVVPCHRVVGANGDLVGYAGGLANKRALLVHEGVLLF